MTDGIRLQSFLNEHTSTKTEAIMNSSFSLSFDGNQDACDTSTSNHIVVRKLSGIRKLFQTRKQSKNSQQQERTRQLSQEDLLTPHQKPSRKRTQSHDWNCPLDGHGRRDTPSVFIYRRLTSELVLYASDLLQHLPATGTLIWTTNCASHTNIYASYIYISIDIPEIYWINDFIFIRGAIRHFVKTVCRSNFTNNPEIVVNQHLLRRTIRMKIQVSKNETLEITNTLQSGMHNRMPQIY